MKEILVFIFAILKIKAKYEYKNDENISKIDILQTKSIYINVVNRNKFTKKNDFEKKSLKMIV